MYVTARVYTIKSFHRKFTKILILGIDMSDKRCYNSVVSKINLVCTGELINFYNFGGKVK